VRRYFGRKLLIYAVTFFVAVTIDWAIPRFMPGDPVEALVARTKKEKNKSNDTTLEERKKQE
jgi:peptide/nickel transport system permease protein